MKAVALVGGEGTRLRPLTNRTPKAMVPILNRPFLEHLLLYLKGFGITEVVLAMGYLPHAIESYFGDGSAWGVRLTYLVETSPLGTGGAVRNAASYLDDTFLVLNGDIFTTLDLAAMLASHRERGALATIALTPVADPSRFGVVVTEASGRVADFVEKPAPGTAPSNYINAGVYILEPELLREIPANTPAMLEKGLFPSLARRGAAFFAFPFTDFWMDMGTIADYLALHSHLLHTGGGGSQGQLHPRSEISGSVLVGPGVVAEAGARLIGPVVLGAGCHIGRGATVQEAVLWEGVWVGRGATLRNAVIASRCHIGEQCCLTDVALGEGDPPDRAVPLVPPETKEG